MANRRKSSMKRMKGGDYMSPSKEIKFGNRPRRRAQAGMTEDEEIEAGKKEWYTSMSEADARELGKYDQWAKYNKPTSAVDDKTKKYRDAANAYEAEQKKKRDAAARKAANESPRAKKQNQAQGSGGKDRTGNVKEPRDLRTGKSGSNAANRTFPKKETPATKEQSPKKPAPKKPAPVESLQGRKAGPLERNMEKQGLQTAKTPQKPAAKKEAAPTGNKRIDRINRRANKKIERIQDRQEKKGLKDRRKISEVVDNVRGRRARKKEAVKKAKSEARANIKAARKG